MHLSVGKDREGNCVRLIKRFIEEDEKKTILLFHDGDYNESESLRRVAPDLEVPNLNHHYVGLSGPSYAFLAMPLIYAVRPLVNSDNFLTAPFIRQQDFMIGLTDGVGFGFDPNTGDYKVIKLVRFIPNEYYPPPYAYVAQLYNLNTNCWRELELEDAVFPYLGCHSCLSVILFNECCHWCVETENSDLILSFDIREIKFTDELQTDLDGNFPRLVVLDNSLALIIYAPILQGISIS
ncbi:hypothetical protein ACH5RR_014187 [Cinchona calisaya]|uniref:Uncharacterized protein n=1 Tax=Cinchona calisaya TaxID=153742 RepID=A0ABD3A252_9GENT